MKQVFTFLMIAGVSLSALAQPTISSFNVPAANSSFPFKLGSDENQSVGAAGNQNWDFSAISYLATSSDAYKTPANTPHGAEFLASCDMTHQDNSGVAYYDWTSTGKTWYGTYNNANYVKYTDPVQLYTLPLTYNVATTADSYAGTKYTSSSAKTYTVAGTSSTIYDGYGSIKTIYGTYTNVVRFKTTMTETQTDNSNSEVTNLNTILYEWYTTSGVMVFTIQEIHSSSPSLSLDAKFIYAFNVIVTGIFNETDTEVLSAGPNPAGETLAINLESLPTASIYEISILNNTGDVLSSNKEYLNQSGQKTIDVSFLKAGWYILSLSSKEGNVRYKFIKK